MTTVTAKKLRTHLSDYLDRLQNGEEITIIRHSEIIGTLKPAKTITKNTGSGVAAMLKRNQALFSKNRGLTDDAVETNDLYHKALSKQFHS